MPGRCRSYGPEQALAGEQVHTSVHGGGEGNVSTDLRTTDLRLSSATGALFQTSRHAAALVHLRRALPGELRSQRTIALQFAVADVKAGGHQYHQTLRNPALHLSQLVPPISHLPTTPANSSLRLRSRLQIPVRPLREQALRALPRIHIDSPAMSPLATGRMSLPMTRQSFRSSKICEVHPPLPKPRQ
jgi:hypothetical protein